MDECANRCGAFHCIWKPHIQWQLRRFGGTSEKKQKADNGCGYSRDASRCDLVEDSYVASAICKVIERSIMFEDQKMAIIRPKSPIMLITSAFCAAATAARL